MSTPLGPAYRLTLIRFDNRAVYRTHISGDDPIHEYVHLSLDRDRFNALGKPGYIDVTIAAAESGVAPWTPPSRP